MPKRILQGTVVSNATDKTIVVRVERKVKHPVFGKFVRQSKKFMAHDENNSAQVGDLVRIQECRPISKRKSWELVTGDAASGAEA
ncbi:MAG: 30S ribosomal protein S17 [Alphaproteobacteria bacterium]